MSSQDNLAAAFAGESQANRKYLAFSQAAEKEGLSQIAKLFRAAAEAETVHALAHFKAMGGVGDTKENLKAAIEGERYEFQEMYPGFLNDAEAESAKTAIGSIKKALPVEEIHHGMYTKALAALEAGGDLEAGEIHVCPVCGNTVFGSAPDKCEICGVPGEKWKSIQ
jgi:rubrerythrin